jgi:AraC family transcriptional regulator of adaptative response / DNA-3-methyladenine glycosylase II
VNLAEDQCYRAVQSKDARFDGWFVTAVRTTGIYCRPSCPAITPKRQNVEFFAAAATAQQHGYRACKRCRPDATPGSPEWISRADVVGRAMRLIADGLVDRAGVAGLACRLGYSERQVHRLLVAEVGSGPLALARAQRAQTARVLIETTAMPITDVAFASGFASVRQFNDTIREVYASSPTALRAAPGVEKKVASRSIAAAGAGRLTLRLAYRQPLDAPTLLGFLGARAVPGVESFDGTTYMRSLRLTHGAAVVALTPGIDAVSCSLWLDDVADAQTAVQRCRRLFDLDSDPTTVDQHLAADPALAPLVAKRPGLRSPGHPDGTELLVRAVLGQQVSVRGARTLAARLVTAIGEPLAASIADVTHLFPSASAIAEHDPHTLAMPRSRARALVGACAQLADGRIVLDAGSDRLQVLAALQALPGIGPWTASYVAMRALGDPDVFMPTDLGVRHALDALGLESSPRAATQRAERWSPWRAYALHHLWASL